MHQTRSRKQQIVMNQDNDNDVLQSIPEDEKSNGENGEKSIVEPEKSEYDFDENSNNEDGSNDDKTNSESEAEYGQKRARTTRATKTSTRTRDVDSSPPRKSARIAHK